MPFTIRNSFSHTETSEVERKEENTMSPLHNGMKVDDHEENGLVGADELFDPAPEDEIVLTVIF